MSRMIKAVELSLVLLLMPMLMQCIPEVAISHMQQLLQLDSIITNRISIALQQLRNQTESKEQQYERLEIALALPISQLDEKIRIYNEYLAYDAIREKQQQQQPDNLEASGYDRADVLVDISDKDKQRTAAYSAFEKRVLKLLKRLDVSDAFTKRVFKAIFSDEEQLKKLKKKLDSLGDDADSNCCLWDFIFGLY
ncbi:uncharacterized protein LOC26527178 isoform X1 [Drosophila mojavensis]|uniref:Uncharacterized protein n=1 Tax=Drosophila mojavensis TaxID=7230 RepID=B4KFV5_DROMO|nr:uncharacterized protein LOC26527178 isoform X1 [Drosophila mojavensis]XP_043864429.1 uncharacterized protein LOC26527178 isoform X1 [Drosophila mojavensis]EDW12081.2 uncharacterized protein Dmoj_GI17491 [Drosophila mojavensis]